MFFSQKPVLAAPQLTIPKTKQKVILIKIKLCKVMVVVNTKETTPIEAPIQAETILKAEATIKTEDISKAQDKIQGEDNLKIEEKAEVKDSLKAKDSLKEEAPIWVKLFVGDVTELVTMLQIVAHLSIKFLNFNSLQHSLKMIKIKMIMTQNMSSPLHQQSNFPPILRVIMKMLGFWIQEKLSTWPVDEISFGIFKSAILIPSF